MFICAHLILFNTFTDTLGYNVTLSATGIKLSTQITDWEDGVANPIITQTD